MKAKLLFISILFFITFTLFAKNKREKREYEPILICHIVDSIIKFDTSSLSRTAYNIFDRNTIYIDDYWNGYQNNIKSKNYFHPYGIMEFDKKYADSLMKSKIRVVGIKGDLDFQMYQKPLSHFQMDSLFVIYNFNRIIEQRFIYYLADSMHINRNIILRQNESAKYCRERIKHLQIRKKITYCIFTKMKKYFKE